MYAKSNVYKIPNALSISLITDDEDRVTGNGLTLVTVSVDVSVTAAVQVIGAVVVILVLSKRGLEHDDHCQCGGLVDELAYWLHFDCFRLLKDSSLERWVKNHCQGFVYIVSKLSKTTLFFFFKLNETSKYFAMDVYGSCSTRFTCKNAENVVVVF